MPELLYRLPRNIITIFSGRNLLWHALAILLTCVVVMSGTDWFYFLSTRGDIFIPLARPAIRLGNLLPILGTLMLLLIGEVRKNRQTITTAWALGQAALLGLSIRGAGGPGRKFWFRRNGLSGSVGVIQKCS